MLIAPLLKEFTDYLVQRPTLYRFDNGVTAVLDEAEGVLWLTSPYGVDSALSFSSTSEMKRKLKQYLEFWSAPRK